MYLLECLNFQIQYVEKSGAKFRIRLNNHVKDGTRRYTIITPSMKTTLTQGGGLSGGFKPVHQEGELVRVMLLRSIRTNGSSLC